jgi:putative endonuclease
MERLFYVYILISRRNYTGVTNDLARRVFEHRTGAVKGFTTDYDIKRLVWYEVHQSIVEAIAQEKRIKRWRRKWKMALIEKMNPQWLDLYETLNQ